MIDRILHFVLYPCIGFTILMVVISLHWLYNSSTYPLWVWLLFLFFYPCANYELDFLMFDYHLSMLKQLVGDNDNMQVLKLFLPYGILISYEEVVLFASLCLSFFLILANMLLFRCSAIILLIMSWRMYVRGSLLCEARFTNIMWDIMSLCYSNKEATCWE